MESNNSNSSFFSAESLQIFSAGLMGLNQEEIRKAKELHIRNAISEYKSEIKGHKNNYFTMALHLLIPIFWPMLFGTQRANKIKIQEKKDKILNALEVWKDDLKGSYQELKISLNDVTSL